MKTHFYAMMASLLLHLLVLLLILLQISPVPIKLSPPTHVLNAYFYEYKKAAANLSSLQPSLKVSEKKRPPIAKSLSRAEETHHDSKKITDKKIMTALNPLAGKEHQIAIHKLLILLHTAIQAVQHYPDNALAMGRRGRTTLAFILYTNGAISDLSVLHSSGTESLDKAALEAVNAAVPFQHVADYLSTPQRFQIDIIFEL